MPYPLDNDGPLACRHHRCLAELLDAASQVRLAPFVKPGAKCLEIRTGGGSVARWLASQVGERGHVTALDLNSVERLPTGPYDLIHARLVLSHLPKRREILRRLVDRLAPDGVIVVGDWSAIMPDPIVIAPSHDAGELYRRYRWTLGEQVLAAWGTDGDWASGTYLAMRGEGLADVHTTVTAEYWRGGGTGLELEHTMLLELEKPLLAAGLTEDELEELGRLLEDPSLVVHGRPLYYTSGRNVLARHLVQEAEHAAQLAVGVGHGDVEPDNQWFGARLAQRPAEPGLVVVRVDGTVEREREARELLLDRPDGGVDRVAALGDGERVDVRPVLRPQVGQRPPAGRAVPLVPRRDVPLSDVLEIRHGPTMAAGA
jgi:SAM-dependent methyltransferase